MKKKKYFNDLLFNIQFYGHPKHWLHWIFEEKNKDSKNANVSTIRSSLFEWGGKDFFLFLLYFIVDAHFESYCLNILKCFFVCMYLFSPFVVKLCQDIKKNLHLFFQIQLLWMVKSINFFLTNFDVGFLKIPLIVIFYCCVIPLIFPIDPDAV